MTYSIQQAQLIQNTILQQLYSQVMGGNQTKVVPNSQSSNTLTALLQSQQLPQQTLSVMLAKLTSKIKFQKQQKYVSLSYEQMPEIQLTQTMIQLFWGQKFEEKTYALYRYLKQFINTLLVKKSMIFVSADQWRLSLNLAQFVMLACDHNIRGFLNSVQELKVINDQQENSQQGKIFKKSQNLSTVQQNFSEEYKKELRDKFRQFIYYSIYAKNKLVPNVSSVSFTQIFRTLECVLNLYVKLEIENPDNSAFKRNIILCTYVIGIGVQYDHSLLIDLATRLAEQVLKKSMQAPQILIQHQSLPPIPSSYFKHLPKFSCKCLYQTLSTYILYTLLIKINQIDVEQLCYLFELIVSVHRPQNKQIMIFITEISKLQETSQKNQVILRKTIKKYVNSSRQGKGFVDVSIRKFLDKENENFCEVRSVGSDSNITQAYKAKSFGNFPLENPSKELQPTPLKQPNIQEIHNLYHKMVIKRFLPSIYENFGIGADNEASIKFQRVFREMIQPQPEQKQSKKNSQEESLQQMNEDRSQKYRKGFKIQQME